MKKEISKILDRFPYIRGLRKDLNTYERWGLPGHFYNPIPSTDEILENENEIFRIPNQYELPGINLCLDEQIELLNSFAEYYKDLPFPEEKKNDFRYFFSNPNYSYSDAIFTYSIIRHYNPKRIIEIGSGYSSCLMLDINQRFFESKIQCSFIEPFPELLHQLIFSEDILKNKILPSKIQQVDLSIFKELEENDILFIDSSHVVKTGSDLQHIFFKIIPALKRGVLIHFHDIFFPFEYPREWVLSLNRAWNEAYMLKSFLMYNDSFKIVAFNTCLEERAPVWFEQNMPLCLKNKGGSIWIQKTV